MATGIASVFAATNGFTKRTFEGFDKRVREAAIGAAGHASSLD